MVDNLPEWARSDLTILINRHVARIPTQRTPSLRRVASALAMSRLVDQMLAEAVQEARKDKATWAEVGVALGGMSRQAACKRFLR